MDKETVISAVVVLAYVALVAFVLMSGKTITGSAVVIDGDTIKLDGEICLFGI